MIPALQNIFLLTSESLEKSDCPPFFSRSQQTASNHSLATVKHLFCRKALLLSFFFIFQKRSPKTGQTRAFIRMPKATFQCMPCLFDKVSNCNFLSFVRYTKARYAQDWTWTSTVLLPPAPQAGVSTNSTTWAFKENCDLHRWCSKVRVYHRNRNYFPNHSELSSLI